MPPPPVAFEQFFDLKKIHQKCMNIMIGASEKYVFSSGQKARFTALCGLFFFGKVRIFERPESHIYDPMQVFFRSCVLLTGPYCTGPPPKKGQLSVACCCSRYNTRCTFHIFRTANLPCRALSVLSSHKARLSRFHVQLYSLA